MRTSARISGAVAAAAVAALLVGGCGSSDDEGKDDKAESSPSAEKTDKKPDGEKSEKPDAGLAGVYKTKAEGQEFALTIVGEAVSLLRDKKMCTGRVMQQGGDQALVLKCPGGIGEERATGKVGKIAAKSLTVTWNGGATDTYTRVAQAPAKLPKEAGDLGKLPGLSDKLKRVTEEPGKVREYPGN